jgi:putative ABC transport system permease protein
LPKPAQEPPQLIGVLPSFLQINSLTVVEGRWLTEEDNTTSAPVCVLGETAKVNLLGYERAVGKYVKVNTQWLQVVGVLAHQATADTEVEGLEVPNRNNLIIAPLNTVMRRVEDNNAFLRDEIDGIYLKVTPGTDSVETSRVVSAILVSTHKDAAIIRWWVPADLLEQRRQTQIDFLDRHDLHRGHFAAGRRHRHHEHYAGHGPGADARDRHPARHRRPAV